MRKDTKKIALVHDFLLTWGGAERVFKVMADMYPEAPIYTLLSDPAVVAKYFPGREIRTSFLQKFPLFLRKHYRFLLPFFAVAVETFDLRDFDLVLSSSSAWGKGIVTRLHTEHIAYLHSPMRFAWENTHSHPGLRSPLRRFFLNYLRLWDKEAAARPDVLIANSVYTQKRIEKFYRREAKVMYPPATSLFEALGDVADTRTKRKYFLVVARLTDTKNIDIIIEAFNKLGLPLTIVGAGREEKRLEKQAEDNITFAGAVSDAELAKLYSGTRALIQPSEEDFGLVAVEALSFGAPVIAYDGGAAREIILPGETGELFQSLTPEVLADGVRRFIEHEGRYSTEAMQRTTARFTTQAFQRALRAEAEETLNH